MLMMLLQAGPLFGQVNRQQQAQGPDAGVMAGVFLCYGVVIVALVVLQILFFLSLSKCLAQCSPRNRTMEPGQVWLNLIPFFGVVWIFITFIRITESLQNEYRSRGMRSSDPEFGKMMGILYMVFTLVSCFPINMIFQIVYWMKIAGFKNELISNKKRGSSDYDDEEDRPRRGGGRRDDEDDDEEDDRPRRRRDED